MKKQSCFWLVVAAISVLAAGGCKKDDTCNLPHRVHELIYTYRSYEEMRHDIVGEGPRDIVQAREMCLYENYVLLNYIQKGIHIADFTQNSITAQAFIPVLGNQYFAVRNGILYANNYNDLIAIDINDIHHPRLVGRLENPFGYHMSDPEKGIVIDAELAAYTIYRPCDSLPTDSLRLPPPPSPAETVNTPIVGAEDYSKSTGGRNSVSTHGSMAHFVIADKYLYAINFSQLKVFDIEDPTNMREVADIQIMPYSNTVFLADGKLYISGDYGLDIYDIAQPAAPHKLGYMYYSPSDNRISDALFVSGGYAYVSMRANDSWVENSSYENKLIVLDVHSSNTPRQIAEYSSYWPEPHALNVQNDILYVSEGPLKINIFEASDKQRIIQNRFNTPLSTPASDLIAAPNLPIFVVSTYTSIHIVDRSARQSLRLVASTQ